MRKIKIELTIEIKEHDSYGCQSNADWVYNTIEEQLDPGESIIDYKITDEKSDITEEAN